MSTQATSTKIAIFPDNTGLWSITQTKEAAQRTAELLMKDLNLHHVFLNAVGFHDHMLHHILALYGTGANVAQIQNAFDLRHNLQRPVQPRHDNVVSSLLSDFRAAAPAYLGKEEHCPDFLAYFQSEIDTNGYELVIRNTLLARDTSADNMLLRLHAGVLHPLIQLMYGIEWKQPAIVAEALAQTAVHNVESLDELLLPSESDAGGLPHDYRMPHLLDLYKEIRASSRLEGAARLQDENKIRDGILQRTREPMLSILRKVRVQDDELEERTAEMFQAIILVASSAAVHPHHHVKFDFFLMNHVNSAIMYLTTLSQAWLTQQEKRRMLEWKIHMDLIEYTARGRTPISVDRVASYVPKIPSNDPIRRISNRLHNFGDDGHRIKQARATALCYELMKD